jgi:hypothetical protein
MVSADCNDRDHNPGDVSELQRAAAEAGSAVESLRSTLETVQAVENAWRVAENYLQNQRNGQTHWTGRLSTSALSTATAISALSQVRRLQLDQPPEHSHRRAARDDESAAKPHS